MNSTEKHNMRQVPVIVNTTGETSPPAIDQTTLGELKSIFSADGSYEEYNQLITLFIDQTKVRLEKIQEAITKNSPQSLKSEAHALKSSSANLGALQMSSFCLQLEKLGSSGTVDGAKPLYDLLAAQFAQAKAELELELSQTSIKKAA
jgi:two-component system, sensor histidine kinase and response regulator